MLLAVLLLPGCGFGKGQGGCVETELEARDVAIDDETEPLRLSAVLTADGVPVGGAGLGFSTHTMDEDGEIEITTAGSAVSDAQRETERVYDGRSCDIGAFGSEKAVGYSVQFRQIELTDDVRCSNPRTLRPSSLARPGSSVMTISRAVSASSNSAAFRHIM